MPRPHKAAPHGGGPHDGTPYGDVPYGGRTGRRTAGPGLYSLRPLIMLATFEVSSERVGAMVELAR